MKYRGNWRKRLYVNFPKPITGGSTEKKRIAHEKWFEENGGMMGAFKRTYGSIADMKISGPSFFNYPSGSVYCDPVILEIPTEIEMMRYELERIDRLLGKAE